MNRFVVGKTLGEGSFGKVKVAVHKETKQKVAIKILSKSKLQKESINQKMNEEIRILKSISHPHIIQLYEVIEDDESINLVMEYAQKGNLRGFMEKHTVFTETQASLILLDILEALQYLHSLRIVHRDLKLANILIDQRGQGKVIDFGFSKKYEPGCKLSTNCGSPCFASPELIRNEPYDPEKVDVWALGVVYFCLLAGKLPFYHHNMKDLFQLIEKARYNEPIIFREKTRALFKGLFQRSPSKRLTLEEISSHPSLKTFKAFREKERKNREANISEEKLGLIKAYFKQKHPSQNLEERLATRKFDGINTLMCLLGKMESGQIQSLMEKQNQGTNMVQSSVSYRSDDIKRFQRQTSKKKLKILKGVKSEKNLENFKYIHDKTLMKYSQKMEKGRLQEILKKQQHQLASPFQVRAKCTTSWFREKSFRCFEDHVDTDKEHILQKLAELRDVEEQQSQLSLKWREKAYEVIISSVSNTRIIKTRPFSPQLVRMIMNYVKC